MSENDAVLFPVVVSIRLEMIGASNTRGKG